MSKYRSTPDDNPCFGCTERYVDVERGTSCHSTCERHKEAKARREERKRKIIEKKNEEGIYRAYHRLKIARNRRARGEK